MNTALEKRISNRALTVWRITGVIKAGIEWLITGIAIFLIHFFNGPAWISWILMVLAGVFTCLHVFIFPTLRWRRWRYEVREEEVELEHGIFFRIRMMIPMVRVQHVETIQGPILRRFHLSSVIIVTAATHHEIPALEEREAEELRLSISTLARVAEEDV